MRFVTIRFACVAAVLLAFGGDFRAQDHPAAPGQTATDPRVGLKPGFKDAGQAARGLELVSSLPKPPGFFDPKMPAGEPTGPETAPKPEAKPEAKPDTKPEDAAKPPAPPAPPRGSGLNFANSDLAFSGQHLFIGNFNGFNVYDLADPRKPKLLASIVCPGG
jgi:hypothetical protein